MSRIIVFDLDGTLVDESQFYREVYSGTLEQLVQDCCGEKGRAALSYYREHHNGQGELALSALDIPLSAWAEKLCIAPLDLIAPRPDMVAAVRSLDWVKVVYTGSPHQLAARMLAKRGFNQDDFNKIIGWQPHEKVPSKWRRSASVFRKILRDFGCQPSEAWSVGDNWEADLQPACVIGMKVAQIGISNSSPAMQFPNIVSFIKHVNQQ